jgi:hypothetical protein
MDFTDSRPRLRIGVRPTRFDTAEVRVAKYVLSSTTCPALMGMRWLIAAKPAIPRQSAASALNDTQDAVSNRPLSRSSASPASFTCPVELATRREAVPSRPWARVMGMRLAISPTLAERFSISMRNAALRLAARLRIPAISPTPTGTVTANTIRNPGAWTAVTATEPTKMLSAFMITGTTCCMSSSMFSTSRTTLV